MLYGSHKGPGNACCDFGNRNNTVSAASRCGSLWKRVYLHNDLVQFSIWGHNSVLFFGAWKTCIFINMLLTKIHIHDIINRVFMSFFIWIMFSMSYKWCKEVYFCLGYVTRIRRPEQYRSTKSYRMNSLHQGHPRENISEWKVLTGNWFLPLEKEAEDLGFILPGILLLRRNIFVFKVG